MTTPRSDRVELLQGTLDLIVLRALATMGPQHAYALAARLEQVTEHPLTLNQGKLYPALVRLEQRGWLKGTWQQTETKRTWRCSKNTIARMDCHRTTRTGPPGSRSAAFSPRKIATAMRARSSGS